LVNTGLFFAASDKTPFEIALPGTCCSCLFGQEGFVMRFRGPCTIFTQNRNPTDMMKLLNPWRGLQGGDGSDNNAASAAAGAM